jgi:N-acetylglutamate synthase-like GNAT family acetyltransferase
MSDAARIRAYQPSDLERCRELWCALVQRHRDLYADPSIGGDAPGLELDAHLARPDLVQLWVAERDGRIVGLCGLLLAGEESELEPIVVDPAQRNRRVGAALAARAIEESRRLGVRFVNVRPVGRNVEAIRFFQRAGFRILGRLELSLQLGGQAIEEPGRDVDVHGVRFAF